MELTAAEKYYEQMLKAGRAYHERKRQAKKDAGTYRSPGRPRKPETPEPNCCEHSKKNIEVKVAEKSV